MSVTFVESDGGRSKFLPLYTSTLLSIRVSQNIHSYFFAANGKQGFSL